MKKSVQRLFSITVFFAIIFIGVSAAAKDKETPGNGKKHSPIISEKVKQKAEAGEMVAVLIKLKEEWEHPLVKRMTTAKDPSSFISKRDIKRLQRVLESSFTLGEKNKDFKINHRLDNIPWISGEISQKALEKLKRHPNVAMIVEDRIIEASLAESGPVINSGSAHLAGYTGAGVTVAVLDTGIDTDHPDLQNDIIWEECSLFLGQCPVTGLPKASGPGSAEDGNGHGTHVSGIITSGNATYKGIAPDTKIVALKILNNGATGRVSDRNWALDWVVTNKDTYGISVVNMSLQSSAYNHVCDEDLPESAAAADAVKAAGIILFASSGNYTWRSRISSPSCLSSVVSVGATYDADVGTAVHYDCTDDETFADKITCFSNISSDLDILAPGSPILSSALGGGLTEKNGTSMASPHAAGVAALILEKYPSFTPDQTLARMVNTGKTIDEYAWLGEAHHGDPETYIWPRIDAAAALNLPDPILTLTISGEGSGIVIGAGIYTNGDTATVTATADTGFAFTGWSGPDAAECDTGSVSMIDDKSCIATFAIDYCPSDPLKIEEGICGCGVPDTDTDSDSTPDCNDTDDDNDGMPDDYEQTEGFNPLDALDASNDPDGDRLTNLDEYNSGTDPNDIDSDNDGIIDGLDAYPFDNQQSSCANLIQNDFSLENFTTVQAAIDDLSANDYDIIQITAADFGEDVLYDRNTILTLSGGYYCNFTNNPSTTLINSLIIRNGTIMVENIVIQPQP